MIGLDSDWCWYCHRSHRDDDARGVQQILLAGVVAAVAISIAVTAAIGLLGSTLGLLTGVASAYLLTSGLLGSGGGGGSPGSGGGAAHFAPIFLLNDLFNVWLLSLSLSLAAGVYPAWKASRLSPLEALRI